MSFLYKSFGFYLSIFDLINDMKDYFRFTKIADLKERNSRK